MVNQIDRYVEEQAIKKAEREKFEASVSIASGIFQEPLYQFFSRDSYYDSSSEYRIGFQRRHNEYLLRFQEQYAKKEHDNYYVERSNVLSGEGCAVRVCPLKNTIRFYCPEVYPLVMRLAKESERIFGAEITLESDYERRDETLEIKSSKEDNSIALVVRRQLKQVQISGL